MQIRTRVKDGATTVEVVDSSDGTIVRTETVGEGQQFVVTSTTADAPADLEFGDVEAIPEPEAEGAEGGATEGEGTGTEAPEGGTGTGSEPQNGEPATTSAASDKPLYRVFAEDVPEGFAPSGLATPDGFTLYVYEGDTEGEAHTAEVGDEVEVGLYAEATDGEQPVVPATGVEQPSGTAEAAEAPAEGSGTPAEGGGE